MPDAPARTPRATYRLQFSASFGFDDAGELAPYLARLGFSHVYASPYLKARPGSTHGYDVVDHNALNPELGDRAAFDRMSAAFRAHGLGQILDVVPNHMGVGGADNPLWLDVLAWGPESPYAGWFDIDWDPDERYLRDKVLVPFLGGQYGDDLAAGNLQLALGDDGTIAVWAYETHRLPVNPFDYGRVLGDAHPELERLGDAFASLPQWRPAVHRRARVLQDELASLVRDRDDVRVAVDAALARFNGIPGDADSWRTLDGLIARQHWRAAHFRVAADDINYRRFFNINDLAGIRMEIGEVFEEAHRLVFALLDDGVLDGLRIDHVDGLLDPKGYLERLRARMPGDAYLVVEKILARHESLRPSWPIDGTTGYDFANLVLGVLVDASNEAAFTRIYADFTGAREPFSEIVRASKLRIMQNEMASELNVLARDAARIARQNPRTADFTHRILRRALREVVASFPVYRTYIDGGSIDDADRRDLDWAFAHARRRLPEVDPSVFDFAYALCTTELVAQPRSGFSRSAVVRFAMRVQQYSGPVMAKGLEDTAFYRYQRFVALNEVGGDPDTFGVSAAAFHRANVERARHWPHAMLTTSTHDTKRGEDARARLAVLSEMPDAWERAVAAWSRLVRARRGDVEAAAPPDRSDEYLLFQMLVGSWPVALLDADALDADALRTYGERIKAAMTKSMREAKVHSTWASPDAAYESAVLGYVDDMLDAGRSRAFLTEALPFVERVARLGVENALVQAALKLTVPGVPDVYQGSESWNDALVDPDNRRPVDFTAQGRLLEALEPRLAADRAGTMRALLARPWDGACKVALTQTLLAFRRDDPALFAEGGYEVLTVEDDDDRIIAFARTLGERSAAVAVRRFPARGATAPKARIALPPLARGTWRDVLTGCAFAADREVATDVLFAVLPVAVLRNVEEG